MQLHRLLHAPTELLQVELQAFCSQYLLNYLFLARTSVRLLCMDVARDSSSLRLSIPNYCIHLDTHYGASQMGLLLQLYMFLSLRLVREFRSQDQRLLAGLQEEVMFE